MDKETKRQLRFIIAILALTLVFSLGLVGGMNKVIYELAQKCTSDEVFNREELSCATK